MTEEDIDFTKFKYCECGCGELILVVDRRGRPRRFQIDHRCRMPRKSHDFSGENNPAWRGGSYIDGYGYKHIWKPDHPFCDHQGYVKEHRLVMEKYLGRYLTREEVVHHINGDKLDNRIENLMLFVSHAEHIKYERRLDMSDRLCSICGCETFVNKVTGIAKWHFYNGDKTKFLCSRCYGKVYDKKVRRRKDARDTQPLLFG